VKSCVAQSATVDIARSNNVSTSKCRSLNYATYTNSDMHDLCPSVEQSLLLGETSALLAYLPRHWERWSIRLCPSLRPLVFALKLLNLPTFDHNFCTYTAHDHSSPGIENLGHRSRSRVTVRFGEDGKAAGLSSILRLISLNIHKRESPIGS